MRNSKVLSLLILPFFCNAQNAQPESQFCDSILALGHESYSNFVDQDLYESLKSVMCFSKETFVYATQSSRLGASVNILDLIDISGEGSGGKLTSEEQYETFCKSSDYQKINKVRFRTDSQKINTSMTNAWATCKQTHLTHWQKKYGTIIGVRVQPSFKEFSVNVDARIAEGNVILNSISPTTVTCSDGKQEIEKTPYDTRGKNYFTLNCKKKSDQDIVFSLSTNAGPSNSVNVRGEIPIYLELQKELARLESELNQQKKTINTLDKRAIVIESCDYPTTNIPIETDMLGKQRANLWNKLDGGEWHEESCPQGKVMVGRETTHHNHHEDRASRYKCCTVSIK